jgi:hypothetical protein
MDCHLCLYCQTAPLAPGKRKYCAEHSRQASAIWKREHRRLWKAQAEKYWLADWPSPEARRAYFRAYMRSYRLRKRLQEPPKPKQEDPTWSDSI